MVVNKLSQDKSLTLKYDYNGRSIKAVQSVTDFLIYTEDQTIKHTPADPISIYGSGEKAINFKWFQSHLTLKHF